MEMDGSEASMSDSDKCISGATEWLTISLWHAFPWGKSHLLIYCLTEPASCFIFCNAENQRRKLSRSAEVRDRGCWFSCCSAGRAAILVCWPTKMRSPKTRILDHESTTDFGKEPCPEFVSVIDRKGRSRLR